MKRRRFWPGFFLVLGLLLMSCALPIQITVGYPTPTETQLPTSEPTETPAPKPTPSRTLRPTTIPSPTPMSGFSSGTSACVTDHIDHKYLTEKDVDTHIALLKELEVEWVRFDVYQIVAELENPEGYDFYVGLVKKLNDAGIRVILILNHSGAVDQPWEEPFDSVEKYRDFVIKAGVAFAELNVMYQMGNEPDYEGPELEVYAQFVSVAYDELKTVDPDAMVITAGVGASHAVEWLSGLYKYGAKGKFDAFAIHRYVYPKEPDPGHLDILRQLQTIMEQNGDNKPMIMTETGWKSDGDDGVTEQQQAEYSVTFFNLIKQNYSDIVPIVCFYRLAERSAGEDDPYFSFVVQDSSQPDGYREKLVYCAMRDLWNSKELQLDDVACK